MKLIVIGAGLFGSIATALARKVGHNVTLIDCRQPLAASKCSGNLTKPSWLEGLGKDNAAIAYGVLHGLYKVQEVNCIIRPLLKLKTTLHWVDPATMLLEPDLDEPVMQVGEGNVRLESGRRLAGTVLVAAGVWTQWLVPNMPRIRWLMGSSLRVTAQVRQPSIYMYAPYKHAVAFNCTPGEVWFGDGAAILRKNWVEEERVLKLKQRARGLFNLNVSAAEVRIGARPYVEGYKSGYFAKVKPKVYVSTGGAKNGMVLAAYQAHQFLEAIS